MVLLIKTIQPFIKVDKDLNVWSAWKKVFILSLLRQIYKIFHLIPMNFKFLSALGRSRPAASAQYQSFLWLRGDILFLMKLGPARKCTLGGLFTTLTILKWPIQYCDCLAIDLIWDKCLKITNMWTIWFEAIYTIVIPSLLLSLSLNPSQNTPQKQEEEEEEESRKALRHWQRIGKDRRAGLN